MHHVKNKINIWDNILALLINKQEPNLKTRDKSHIKKMNKDVYYSAIADPTLTIENEFWKKHDLTGQR